MATLAGDREVPRERRSVNGEFAACRAHLQVSDFAEMFNDAGKHVFFSGCLFQDSRFADSANSSKVFVAAAWKPHIGSWHAVKFG